MSYRKIFSALFVIFFAVFTALAITHLLPTGKDITLLLGGAMTLGLGLVVVMMGWLLAESEIFGLFSGLLFTGVMVAGLLNPDLSQSFSWLISGIACGVLSIASMYCMAALSEKEMEGNGKHANPHQ